MEPYLITYDRCEKLTPIGEKLSVMVDDGVRLVHVPDSPRCESTQNTHATDEE